MTPPPYRELVRSYLDLKWQLDPVAATQAGVGLHDERLGRYTRADIKGALASLTAMGSAFEECQPTTLDEEIDRTAVLGEIRATILRLERERPFEQNPGFHLSHLLGGLFALLIRDDRSPEDRGRAIAARLGEMPRFLADARATLRRPPKVFTETAQSVARGGTALLDEAVPAFADTLPAGDGAALREALPEARDALREFEEFLAGELAERSDGDFAVGRELFDAYLHYEHALQDSAPELLRYGTDLVGRLEEELARRAEALSASDGWRPLARRLRHEHPSPASLVGAYAGEMERARAFVAERGLVTIPAGSLRVVATPAFMQPLIPFAAYDAPGAFSFSRTGFFYVSRPPEEVSANQRELLLQDHCVHELAATALHEGYPGHHLHLLTAQAQDSPIRKVLWTPLTVEGWALYCEELMGEEGFYATAEQAFFQRVHLLWRAARVVLDVSLHTAGMSYQKAVRYMNETVGVSEASATAEVRRYCAHAGYQLCYAVGRRELLRLRDDYRRRAGASFSLRSFHDAVLSYGGLPVSLIRWGLGLVDG